MQNLIKSVATLATAGGLCLTGLLAPSQAVTGKPLPAAEAGPLVGWGAAPGADVSTLEGLDVVDADASNLGWGAAVLPDGSVKGWGSGRPSTSGLSGVAAIDVSGAGIAALDQDGSVSGAGGDGYGLENVAAPAHADDVPDVAALTHATDVAVDQVAAAAVQDGHVYVWGDNSSFVMPPRDLGDVTQIAGGGYDFSAVRSDGTVANWGMFSTTPVPADLSGNQDVAQEHAVAIAGGELSGDTGSTYAAVLDDGSVEAWNAAGPISMPSTVSDELAGKNVVDIDVSGSIVALTDDGEIVSWGGSQTVGDFPADSSAGVPTAVSAGMNPDGTTFAYAIMTPFKATTAPAITGIPAVGQALTANPATFSVTPDSVTGQWFAGDSPITGAIDTTYTLTAAEVGKTITYRSTATKGEDTVTSESAPTATVAAAPTGDGTGSPQPTPGGVAPIPNVLHQQLVKDQAALKKDKKKLKTAKKAYQKAHGAKKAKLKKKVAKLAKKVKKDKKAVKADK